MEVCVANRRPGLGKVPPSSRVRSHQDVSSEPTRRPSPSKSPEHDSTAALIETASPFRTLRAPQKRCADCRLPSAALMRLTAPNKGANGLVDGQLMTGEPRPSASALSPLLHLQLVGPGDQSRSGTVLQSGKRVGGNEPVRVGNNDTGRSLPRGQKF